MVTRDKALRRWTVLFLVVAWLCGLATAYMIHEVWEQYSGQAMGTCAQPDHVALVASTPIVAAASPALPAAPDYVRHACRVGLFNELNLYRLDHGLRPLEWGGLIGKVARLHADRMAGRLTLYHNPRLAEECGRWDQLAENVGTGPDLATVEAAFYESDSHRANILGRDWERMGVGVTHGPSRVWVSVVFKDPPGPSR